MSTLQNRKAIRENLGGYNLHHEQDNSIPEDLDKQYYYHPECFKICVCAKTLAKSKEKKDACEQSRSKRQNNETETGLFSDTIV